MSSRPAARTQSPWSVHLGSMSTCCRARYPGSISETVMTPETLALRELLVARRDEFQVLLDGYGATNPKLFGSVARGTASAGSDIDILVEVDPAEGSLLMRASGLLEETHHRQASGAAAGRALSDAADLRRALGGSAAASPLGGHLARLAPACPPSPCPQELRCGGTHSGTDQRATVGRHHDGLLSRQWSEKSIEGH